MFENVDEDEILMMFMATMMHITSNLHTLTYSIFVRVLDNYVEVGIFVCIYRRTLSCDSSVIICSRIL